MRALVADLPQGREPQAEFRGLHLDARLVEIAHDLGHRHVGIERHVAEHAAVSIRGIAVVEEAMQERGVRWIDADFERLQPVALDQTLEREGVRVGCDQTIEMRQLRRRAGAHIGKQDAAALHHRIGFLTDIGAEIGAFRLGRRFKAFAVDVEQPAVERTAQSAAFKTAERQIGAAMRTGAADETIAALAVAEDDQIFAEQPDRLDRPRSIQFLHQRGGLPVAAHQIAGGRAGTDAGDLLVLFLAEHLRAPYGVWQRCVLALCVGAAVLYNVR